MVRSFHIKYFLERFETKTFSFGDFPIEKHDLENLIRSSYHASSIQDFYSNFVFEVGKEVV